MSRRHAATVSKVTGISPVIPPAIKTTARRQPQRLALEPRLLFDGAAVATAVAALADGHAAATVAPAAAPADAHHDHAMAELAAALPDASAAPHTEPHEIVFIDKSLPNLSTLLADVPRGTETVLIDPDTDGLAQIASTLANRSGITALHIVTHGNESNLQIGSTTLNSQNMAGQYAETLKEIGTHLSADADVLIYGCNFGAGVDGTVAVNELALALGADVAASTDATGSAALGGNWTLETHAGQIEAHALDAANWDGLLLLGLPVNTAPVALPDVAVAYANTSLNINVLANDIDLDGDHLTVTQASAGSGTVVINPNGTLTYTPAHDTIGIDTINYTVRDPGGLTSSSLVAVTVLPVLHLPTITLPTLYLFTEDQPIIFANLLGNQITLGNVDGGIVEAKLHVPIGGLTINENANVTLTQGTGINDSTVSIKGTVADVNAALNGLIYTPGADYNGPVNLTIDLGHLGLPLEVQVILPIGIAPVADIVDDHVNATQNQPVSFNVLANDTFENPTRAVTSFSTPSHGSVTIDAQGNALYTPGSGYLGTDTFTYTVTSNGTTETATVTVDIGLAANHAPTAVGSVATANASDGQTVSLNTAPAFNDSDGDALIYTATGLPSGLSINPSTGAITGTLDGHASQGGNHGDYSVTVTASDGRGGQVSQNFHLLVGNPAPTAVNDSVSGHSNSVITGNVLSNDSDPDGDALSVNTTPVVGPQHGTLVLNSNGTFIYTPTLNYSGTDSFTYQLVDSDGGTSQATVTFNVTATNTAPITVGSVASGSANDSSPVVIPTGANFLDLNGDTLTYSATGLPSGLSIDVHTGIISGTMAHDASSGMPGGVYNVTVQADDGHGGTATQSFSLTAINVAPVANADVALGTANGTVTGNVLSNDTDPDGDTLSVNTTPVAAPQHGTLVLNSDGSFVYTPATGFQGTDSFTYQLIDSDGGTAQATVLLGVAPPPNQAPTTVGSISSTSGNDSGTVAIATAANFIDLDGNALTYTATGLPHGLSIDASTGLIIGTLDHDASSASAGGVYNVTVQVDDGHGGTATQSFSLTAVNVAPIANADVATGTGNGAITGNVLSNDLDPDGDTLQVNTTPLSAPQHGTLVLNSDGSFVYTPTANYIGTDSFTYQLIDSDGGTAQATVIFTVAAPPNHAPTTVGSISTSPANDSSTVSIATAANFSDQDGNTLTYTATGLPHGLSIDANTGLITGTLDHDASSASTGGTYHITVQADDGHGGTATQSFALTAVNVAPVANADAAGGTANGNITGNVLSNDSDPDGDTLQVNTTPVAAPQHGTLVLNSDGSFIYTPATGYQGSDSFTYQLIDSDGGTAQATVTITVAAAPNHPPSTVGSIASSNANDSNSVAIATAANFADLDGNTLTYTATGLPHGLSIDASTGLITGTLDHDASSASVGGVYNVTVQVDDGHGGTATQSFSLTAVNVAPIANADVATGTGNGAITGNVLSNDLDPDGDTLQVNTTPVSAPQHGTLVLNSDGSFVYTPTANYIGTDSFTYQLIDSDGGTAQATVIFTVVAPPNHIPTTVGSIGSASGNDSGTVAIATAANFVDVDGNTLTYTATGLPHGLSIDANTGLITGTLDHDASSASTGGIYHITVQADDGHGGIATQSFALTAVNVAPLANADLASGNQGGNITGNVLSNDLDPDGDTLSVNITPVAAPQHGTLVLNSDGSFVYTPAANYSGTDSFTYQLIDSDGGTAQATVTLAVLAPGNHVPSTVGSIASANGNDSSTVVIATAAHFLDLDGNALTYTATGLPNGLNIDVHSGLITGTLEHDASSAIANGIYHITVQADDGHGGLASQTFTLTAVNVTPVANADLASGTQGSAITGNVMSNDTDPDGDTLHVNTTPLVAPLHGTLVLNSDGSFIYTPNANYIGTDSFTYQLIDSDGGTAQSTMVFSMAAAPNSTPTTVGQISSGSANDSGTVSIATATNFNDPDGDTLTYSATGLPPGLVIDAQTGVISGTLAHDASSAVAGGIYSITVQADDGRGGSAFQVFNLTAINQAPVAGADSATIAEDGSATGNVLANDSDPDGDALHVNTTPVVAPQHGSLVLNSDGSYAYTPDANYHGTDSFTYQLIDSDGGTSTATVTFVIQSVNDAPTTVGTATPIDANDGSTVSIQTAGLFDDADGDVLTYTATGLPPGLSIDPHTGEISGTMSGQASSQPVNGVYTITVTADDGQGGSASQTLVLHAHNLSPTAGDDTVTGVQNQVVTGNVLTNDSDPDGDPLSINTTPAVAPQHGTLVLNSDGSFAYTPNAGYIGSDSFSYQLLDADGGSAVATVTINVDEAAPASGHGFPRPVVRFIANGPFAGETPDVFQTAQLDGIPPATRSLFGNVSYAVSSSLVLTEAVNNMENLQALGDLSADKPLLAAVDAIDHLNSGIEIRGDKSPLSEALGDLNSASKVPLTLGNIDESGYAGVPMPDSDGQLDAQNPSPTEEELEDEEAAQAQTQETALINLEELPITLTAQLRVATLHQQRELDALAKALI